MEVEIEKKKKIPKTLVTQEDRNIYLAKELVPRRLKLKKIDRFYEDCRDHKAFSGFFIDSIEKKLSKEYQSFVMNLFWPNPVDFPQGYSNESFFDVLRNRILGYDTGTGWLNFRLSENAMASERFKIINADQEYFSTVILPEINGHIKDYGKIEFSYFDQYPEKPYSFNLILNKV